MNDIELNPGPICLIIYYSSRSIAEIH